MSELLWIIQRVRRPLIEPVVKPVIACGVDTERTPQRGVPTIQKASQQPAPTKKLREDVVTN